ncbi:Type IV fimbrial biogenesis protein PilY1, partial [hydrothermal vent metagenome]
MKTLRMLPPVAVTINVLVTGLLLIASTSQATLNLSDNPLFAAQSAPPLTLMTMGRSHKLYYEAYNDASDLNGDGILDTNYKPDVINYYGYFGSNICYVYDTGDNRFEPSSATADKRCSGSGEWSGDFL